LVRHGIKQSCGTQSQEIIVYQDLIALFLEIMNSILLHHLKDNPQLVYALLLKREAFAAYRLNARLSELVANLESIINYFHARVSEANLRAPSTSEVLEIIDQATRTWTPDRLKSFPELKFQYAEEVESQQFFCPYVWALVHRRTFIYWNEEKAHILDQYRLVSYTLCEAQLDACFNTFCADTSYDIYYYSSKTKTGLGQRIVMLSSE